MGGKPSVPDNGNTRPIVVITGASGGIGKAIARCLHDRAGEDIRLALHANRQIEAVQSLAAEMAGALLIQADLGHESGRNQLVEAIAAAGDVCGLINAAGTDLPHEPAIDITENAIQSIMNVNFTAPVCLMRDFGKLMARGDGGAIVNISSVLAHMTLPGSAIYRASKAALEAATLQFAREFGPRGVRVNAVRPGFIETAMTAGISDEMRSQMQSRIPLDEFGTTEQVAQAVWSLIDNDYINGSILTVDGGLSS